MEKIVGELKTTMPHNPEEKGVAERLNRTFLDGIRSVLFTVKMDDMFFPYAA